MVRMIRLEVVVKGGKEEEMGRDLLSGVYKVIEEYGCTDVSVRIGTVEAGESIGLQIPRFLQPYVGREERRGPHGECSTNGD